MTLSWQIVRLELKETFSIAYGNYSHRDALIVTLSTTNCEGYGECTAIDYYHISLKDFIERLVEIKDLIEKQPVVTPFEFYTFLQALALPSFLRSALDCAYWDLFGKLESKSFVELNSIPVDHLPHSSITISVDTVEKQIQKIRKSEWCKFKVKCSHFDESAIEKLLHLDAAVALDSNGSFTKENCLWLESNPAVARFSYLEQPMKTGTDYTLLHSDRYANWMADEDCQEESSLPSLKAHYRSINIKLVKCGGLTPALRLIRKAREMDFGIMIGCMTETTIGISAGAVLAPLADYADLDGANLIANDIAVGSQINKGKIELAEAPGLGIRLK